MNDRFFRNGKTGEVVLGQAPNTSMLTFVGGSIVSWLFPDDTAGRVGGVVAATALTIWGAGELIRGASPFRRMLGLLTLGGLVAMVLRNPR